MDPICPVEDGLYADIPFVEYSKWPLVNSSLLREYRETPADAHYYMLHGTKDTKSMRMGRALHSMLLEPASFVKEYAVQPVFEGHVNSNKYKHAKAAFVNANEDKIIITTPEREAALRMLSAIRKHDGAASLLNSHTFRNELSVIFTDHNTGLRCKSRIDLLAEVTLADGASVVMLADVKTTKDPSDRAFARQMGELGYHIQAAMYVMALDYHYPSTRNRKFAFILVQNQDPWKVAVKELGFAGLLEGASEVKRLLALHQKCTNEGHWPGYPQGITKIDLPDWAYYDKGDDYDR